MERWFRKTFTNFEVNIFNLITIRSPIENQMQQIQINQDCIMSAASTLLLLVVGLYKQFYVPSNPADYRQLTHLPPAFLFHSLVKSSESFTSLRKFITSGEYQTIHAPNNLPISVLYSLGSIVSL